MDGLSEGISILSKDYGIEIDSGGMEVTAKKTDGNILHIKKSRSGATIRYRERIHFFRALGLFLEASIEENEFEITETPQFTVIKTTVLYK